MQNAALNIKEFTNSTECKAIVTTLWDIIQHLQIKLNDDQMVVNEVVALIRNNAVSPRRGVRFVLEG